MTKENRERNAQVEIERAGKIREEALLLFDNGHIPGAVSRLYYFLLFHVRALLLTKGLEPKSHEGVLRVYSLHFVKDGPFSPDSPKLFARLMKFREEADYAPYFPFSEKDFIELSGGAEALAAQIRDHLQKQGYL